MRAIAVRQLNDVLLVPGHLVNAVDLSRLDAFAALSRARPVLGHVPSRRARLVVARPGHIVRSGGQVAMRAGRFAAVGSMHTLDDRVLGAWRGRGETNFS